MSDKKVCHVYVWNGDLWNDDLLISSFNRTITGLWIGGNYIVRMKQTDGQAEIGAEIINALDANQFGVPLPTLKRNALSAIEKAAGFKSSKEFYNSVRGCDIDFNGDAVFLCPMVRAKYGPGLDILYNSRKAVEFDALALGKSVMEILDGDYELEKQAP